MSSYDKPKAGLGLGPDGHSCATQSEGSKLIKCEHLPSISTPASIGKAAFNSADKVAGPYRIYDNNYSKVQPEKDDIDEVSPALGNPLRW